MKPRYLPLLCLLLVGCAVPPHDVTTALEPINQSFETAFTAGDAATLGAFYTEDAMTLPPNEEIASGRAAIEAHFQAGFAEGLVSLDLETTEALAVGDYAFEVGRFTVSSPAGETLDQGKYVVIWHRVGGNWLIHRDIWNSNQPASAMAPPPPAPADTTAMAPADTTAM